MTVGSMVSGLLFVPLYSRQRKEHASRLDSEEFARLSPITRRLLFVHLEQSDVFQVKYHQLIYVCSSSLPNQVTRYLWLGNEAPPASISHLRLEFNIAL
jgi:hypothetical protein